MDKQHIEEGIEKGLMEIGFEPVMIQWAGSPNRPIIRLRMDTVQEETSESGVTVEDCARASRYLEGWLDQEDILPEKYVLEVSSPGVNRPLIKLSDWERFVGQSVMIQTHRGTGGEKSQFEGKLVGADSTAEHSPSVQLLLNDGEKLKLQLSDVKKANLLYDW